jgi:hypothetical protein
MTAPTLPGADPRFHEFRRYMTPVKYKGGEILGYVASCKHSGCRWSATYANNDTRDAGMFIHRSKKVVAARIEYFSRTLKNEDMINDVLIDTSDKYSDTFTKWKLNVSTVLGHLTGGSLDLMPADNKLQVGYHLGLGARMQARKIFLAEFDVTQ